MKSTIFLSCCLLFFSLNAEKMPFDRYQSIIDRQMFGPLPPGFDPTKSPNEVQKSSVSEKELTQEQEKIQSAIHFSVINVTPDGATVVGFTDNSDPKVPRHYYLKVGESRDNWTVKEADPQKATMTIAKGDIEVTLSLGGNSAKGGATTRAGDGAQLGINARRAGSAGLLGNTLSQRRRRRQMEAAAEQAKVEEAAREKEAERQALAEQEKQQREAERAEQRQQLMAMQEELKRMRESQKASAESAGTEGNGNESTTKNDAQ